MHEIIGSAQLRLGVETGSKGTYELNGGLLDLQGAVAIVGRGGEGKFVQARGTSQFAGLVVDGRGTFEGQSGVLLVEGAASIPDFGEAPPPIPPTRGDTANPGDLLLGAAGSYQATARSSLKVANDLVVGTKGGNGTLTFEEGEVVVRGSEYVGFGGTGEVEQKLISGSSYRPVHIVTRSLVVGEKPGGMGAFHLQTGELSANSEYVGVDHGTGTFTHHLGTNTTQSLTVGAGGNGVYEFYSGVLDVGMLSVGSGGEFRSYGNAIAPPEDPDAGPPFVDLVTGTSLTLTGNGTVKQNGALVKFDYMELGIGSYFELSALENGAKLLIGRDTEQVSEKIYGRMVQKDNGAAHVVTGGLLVDSGDVDAPGYKLQAGGMRATNVQIGESVPGYFQQTDGWNIIDGALYVGSTGASGSYDFKSSFAGREAGDLSRGRLTASVLRIGEEYGARSNFAQDGGTAAVGVLLWVRSTGRYSLADSNNVGAMVGAASIICDGVIVGEGEGATDREGFLLNGGTVSTISTQVGWERAGLWRHTKGKLIADLLEVGSDSGGSGRYELSGSGIVDAKAQFISRLDRNGTGTFGVFEQNGGTNKVDTLTIGLAGKGTYLLINGPLDANDEIVGNGGEGTFTQTGGINTLTGMLTISGPAGSPSVAATYFLAGNSTLSAPIEIVGVTRGAGKFTHLEGLNSFGSLTLRGVYELTGGAGRVAGENIAVLEGGLFVQKDGTVTVTEMLSVEPGLEYLKSGGSLDVKEFSGWVRNTAGTFKRDGREQGIGTFIGVGAAESIEMTAGTEPFDWKLVNGGQATLAGSGEL